MAKPSGIPPQYDRKEAFYHFCAQINGAYFGLKILEQFMAEGGGDNERIMNTVAPIFFRVAEAAIQDQVMMIVARITDKPYSINNPANANVTVQRIIADWTTAGDSLRAKVEALYDKTEKQIERVKSIRNKVHSHLDVSVNVNKSYLPKTTIKSVMFIVMTLKEIANEISNHHTINYPLNHHFGTGEIKKLFETLERGVESVEADGKKA